MEAVEKNCCNPGGGGFGSRAPYRVLGCFGHVIGFQVSGLGLRLWLWFCWGSGLMVCLGSEELCIHATWLHTGEHQA